MAEIIAPDFQGRRQVEPDIIEAEFSEMGRDLEHFPPGWYLIPAFGAAAIGIWAIAIWAL